MHRGGVARILPQVIPLHRGRFRREVSHGPNDQKRANADDRWKVASQMGPFSAADSESTPAEFTCSRGTRREVNPAAQRLERHPVDALSPDPEHEPVPRRHGTSDRCPGCRALISAGRAQGHTEECRIRVEGELRKTEEGKARLRAAASRVGDTLSGRALKRVRFAEDQDGGNGASMFSVTLTWVKANQKQTARPVMQTGRSTSAWHGREVLTDR